MSDEAPKSNSVMRGRPFKPGEGGRKPGSRNRATLLVESLLNGEARGIGETAISLAIGGDPTARKLCLDRIAPVRKGRPTPFRMPAITSLNDLPLASLAILDGVADGSLTPSEAAELAKVLDAHARVVELADIDQRVSTLEKERTR